MVIGQKSPAGKDRKYFLFVGKSKELVAVLFERPMCIFMFVGFAVLTSLVQMAGIIQIFSTMNVIFL